MAFNNPCSVNLVPVEQGPFHHVLPGTQSLSIATAGCNLRCQYCQNWETAQKRPDETRNLELDAEAAVREGMKNDCRVITFTYTEPVVYSEYLESVSDLARAKGFRFTVCSALYIHKEPLKRIAKKVDAFCGALKSFNDEYYQKVCGVKLAPVLDALVTIKESKKWLEVVNLIVPGLNDDMTEIKKLCDWHMKNLGKDTPLHFARFTPAWKFQDLPATPHRTLEDARKVAQDAGIEYPYISNCPGHEGANTYCPGCKQLLIRRLGLRVTENKIKGGACPKCHHLVSGWWK